MVRTDRDLRVLGKVADLVPTAAPIAVGDYGRIGDTGFTVGGRLQLDHGKGPWDEWYVGLDDGRWGWLARAQGRWYLTFPVEASGLPTWDAMVPGNSGQLPGGGQHQWTAVERGHSRMISAQGELPFPTRASEAGRYVDLQAPGGGFGTLDYGDGSEPPRFYVGQQYEANQITWTQAAMGPRPTETVDVQKLRCPTCGGPVPIMVPEQTERAACPACNSLLDFSHGALSFLSQLNQQPLSPYIPLGTEGTLDGDKVMCIGFMERCTIVDGITYAWREYLLHSEAGYRWLLEDSNHFTLLKPINPADVRVDGHQATYGGRGHRLFQTASVHVRYVIGEFYWQVSVGERSQAADYIDPPYIVSEERSQSEVNWSAGRYVKGDELWKAFALPGEPPPPRDVAPAQPNPIRLRFPFVFAAVALALLGVLYVAMSRDVPQLTLVEGPVAIPVAPEPAMIERGNLTTTAQVTTTPNLPLAGPSVSVGYTPSFAVPPNVETLRVAITSNMGNGWIGMACALVNETTGVTTEFVLEQDLFHSVSPAVFPAGSTSSVDIGGIVPGQYTLRMDTRWARKATETAPAPTANLRVSSYDAAGNASQGCCMFSGLILILPIPLVWIRKRLFEGRRWRNSNV